MELTMKHAGKIYSGPISVKRIAIILSYLRTV